MVVIIDLVLAIGLVELINNEVPFQVLELEEAGKDICII
jgi:hypothetical protein